MGSKERRERQRQELRQAILGAAQSLAAREGWQAVTIRKVAERVEYSPPMIYEHFANKEALLLELVREGYQQLLAEVERAIAPAGDSVGRLFGLARAYWEFAWQHPELYQVMHGLDGVPFCSDATTIGSAGGSLAEADAVFDVALAALRAVAPAAQQSDLEAQVFILWALLHGLVALTMADRVFGGRECAEKLLDRALRGFLASLEVL